MNFKKADTLFAIISLVPREGSGGTKFSISIWLKTGRQIKFIPEFLYCPGNNKEEDTAKFFSRKI